MSALELMKKFDLQRVCVGFSAEQAAMSLALARYLYLYNAADESRHGINTRKEKVREMWENA